MLPLRAGRQAGREGHLRDLADSEDPTQYTIVYMG